MNIRDNKGIELRAIEYRDVQCLKRIINDPDIEEMVAGSSHPVSDDEQINWITNLRDNENDLKLMIDLESFGAIGIVSLTDIDMKNGTASVNIKMKNKEELRNKGYGSQALDLIIDYSFNQLNLNCLVAEILDYNIPSQKLFEKYGFKYEATLRDRGYKQGAFQNHYSYSLLKKEYE